MQQAAASSRFFIRSLSSIEILNRGMAWHCKQSRNDRIVMSARKYQRFINIQSGYAFLQYNCKEI